MQTIECPDCHFKREHTDEWVVHVMPTTEGRCVTCYDKFCGWMNDLYCKMSEDERRDLDKISLPNIKKVTEFFKEFERNINDNSNG